MIEDPTNPKRPDGESAPVLSHSVDPQEPTITDEQIRDLQNSLIEKIRAGDRAGVGALVDAWGKEHGFEHFFVKIMEPALIKIGEDWANEATFSISQSYIAARIAEDVLLKTLSADIKKPQQDSIKGPVVIGNIEDDFHALGRRMVGIFLRAEGWVVYDLGNDVPPEEFVDKACEVDARVIGVSALMLLSARNIKKLRSEIDRRGLTGKILLAVGGAAFDACPGLVKEVGGDGTATNALTVGKLFGELWQMSLQNEEST